MNKKLFGFISLGIVGLYLLCSFNKVDKTSTKTEKDHPKIVNIVNFIRLLEPRDPKITEEVLYETVVKQVASFDQVRTLHGDVIVVVVLEVD